MASAALCSAFLLLLLLEALLGPAAAAPLDRRPGRLKRQVRAPKTEVSIHSFHVQTTIVSRYAVTKVWSVMFNPHTESKEAVFDLDLPNAAFVSNFTLTLDGKDYVAEVKEKLQAKRIYDEAQRQGKTAAHVSTRERETDKFRVLVNVEAGEEIAFTLTYEQLLQRQLGRYQHAVSIRPQQVVQNMSVEVTISERTGIEYVRVLPLRTSRLLTNNLRGEGEIPPSTHIEKGSHCARVTFTPSPSEQASYSRTGIMADFVVQYDVNMKDVAGDVQIYNGYFVHYFAPRGLPTVQKNVVFVIDVSGSMYGTKIKQTKKAMNVILSDLHQDDFFNIITFSDVVNVWKSGPSIQATPQNIKGAKDYVNKIEAEGWTDINAALLAAAAVFNQTTPEKEKGKGKKKIPLIIFLTDGEPTSGVTTAGRILSNARHAMAGNISLFGLAFGDDADYNLMRRMSLENRGVARRIYEDADATLQLKGFYDEIASPLLYDIQLSYLGNSVQDVTQTLFPNYFAGSELVVAGKVKPGVADLPVRMTAKNYKEQVSLENDIPVKGNASEPAFGCSEDLNQVQSFVQRLWAYFTIQDLLKARIKANDTTTRRLLTEKATNLSLKYNFVTPVTSMIVVKPEQLERTKTPRTSTSAAPVTAVVPTPVAQASAKVSTATTTTRTTTAVNKPKVTSGPRVTKPVVKTTRPGSTTTTIKPGSLKTTPTLPTTATKGNMASTKGAPNTEAPPALPKTTTTKGNMATTKGAPNTEAPPARPKTTTTKGNMVSTKGAPNTEAPPALPKTTTTKGNMATIKGPPNTEAPPALPKNTTTKGNMVSTKGPPNTEAPPTLPKTTTTKGNMASTKGPPNTEAPPLVLMTTSTFSVPTSVAAIPTSRAGHQYDTTSTQSADQHPHTQVHLAPGGPKTEKLSLAFSTATPITHVHVTAAIPTTEAQPDVLLHASTRLSTIPPNATAVNETQPTQDTLHGTSVSTSSSHIPLQILSPMEESELLGFSDADMMFVESVNPPPMYSFLTTDADAAGGKGLDVSYGDYTDFPDEDNSYYVIGPAGAQTFTSSADGDPHFLVMLPSSQDKLCFTVDGRPGDILRLLSDPITGVTVNGHLLGAPLKIGHEDRMRTYFDVITIIINRPRVSYIINITLDAVTVLSEGRLTIPTNKPAVIRKPHLALKVSPSSNVTIWVSRGLELMVLFHHYRHPTYLQLDHLGLYLVKAEALRASAQGLLGQFQGAGIRITKESVTPNLDGRPGFTAALQRNSLTVPVTLVTKMLKDSVSHPQEGRCWLVKRDDVDAILGGTYRSYLVPHLLHM